MSATRYNIKIYKLFSADQADRSGNPNDADWEEISIRDEKRKTELNKILALKPILSGEDYFMITMLHQHGKKISDIKKAKSFAYKSMKMGYEKSKWLYAATTDRMLMYGGEKQKYGTQYKKLKSGRWVLWPVDRKTTDEERAKLNVNKMEDAKKLVDELNT